MSINLRGRNKRSAAARSEDSLGEAATPVAARPYVVAAPDASIAPVATRAAWQREYVLVVEGDPLLRRSLDACIAHAGYRVEAVATGAAALERGKRGRPQLVIAGQQLRDLSGAELIRMLRAQRGWADIPAILSIDLSETKALSKPRCHVPGVVHVVDKGNTAELLRTVSSVVPTASFPDVLRVGWGG